VEPWEAPLVRLGGGQVLIRGSALLDLLRALDAALAVSRRVDHVYPNSRVLWLREELAAAAETIRAGGTAPSGSHPGMGSADEVCVGIVDATDLVDTKEAAAMLGCQPRNVRDLHARKVLESGRLVAGRLMFERVEIAAEVNRRAEARNTKESA
jgi:hypothetical protein